SAPARPPPQPRRSCGPWSRIPGERCRLPTAPCAWKRRQSPIRIFLVALPKAPVSFARDREVPHISYPKARLQPAEFWSSAKPDFFNKIGAKADSMRVLLVPPFLTDAVEKVRKCLVAIFSKGSAAKLPRRLIWHPGRYRSRL